RRHRGHRRWCRGLVRQRIVRVGMHHARGCRGTVPAAHARLAVSRPRPTRRGDDPGRWGGGLRQRHLAGPGRRAHGGRRRRPAAVGVLTGVAPGRFAAAINQAPMYRRTRGWPGLALDFALNAVATFRLSRHWPAAHLLRHVFDTCATFDDAVRVLSTAPIAKPVLFSLSGTQRGEACLIERTQSDAVVWRGTTTIANDWHPSGARWPGHWMARSACPRGTDDSERRRQCLENHVPHEAFDWVRPPVRNAFTRLAVEASAATG